MAIDDENRTQHFLYFEIHKENVLVSGEYQLLWTGNNFFGLQFPQVKKKKRKKKRQVE